MLQRPYNRDSHGCLYVAARPRSSWPLVAVATVIVIAAIQIIGG